MKNMAFLGIIAILLLTGCTTKETTTNTQSNASEPVVQNSNSTIKIVEYVCWDNSTVSNRTMCPPQPPIEIIEVKKDCQELGGYLCTGNTTCASNWLNSSDSYCCPITCKNISINNIQNSSNLMSINCSPQNYTCIFYQALEERDILLCNETNYYGTTCTNIVLMLNAVEAKDSVKCEGLEDMISLPYGIRLEEYNKKFSMLNFDGTGLIQKCKFLVALEENDIEKCIESVKPECASLCYFYSAITQKDLNLCNIAEERAYGYCSMNSISIDRYTCKYVYAQYYADLSSCSGIEPGGYSESQCKMSIIEIINKPELCEEMGERKEDCYFTLAITKGQINLCELAGENKLKCYESLNGNGVFGFAGGTDGFLD